MKFRVITLLIGLCSLAFNARAETLPSQKPIAITVYRSPTCGCCKKWIDHLKQNNFIVEDILAEDMKAIKDKYQVPKEMASCHTALVDGYVIEGHVPAIDIVDLLTHKSAVIGISVPGMVTGTPGMEMGGRNDPYDIVSFDKDRNFKVIKSYNSKK